MSGLEAESSFLPLHNSQMGKLYFCFTHSHAISWGSFRYRLEKSGSTSTLPRFSISCLSPHTSLAQPPIWLPRHVWMEAPRANRLHQHGTTAGVNQTEENLDNWMTRDPANNFPTKERKALIYILTAPSVRESCTRTKPYELF